MPRSLGSGDAAKPDCVVGFLDVELAAPSLLIFDSAMLVVPKPDCGIGLKLEELDAASAVLEPDCR